MEELLSISKMTSTWVRFRSSGSVTRGSFNLCSLSELLSHTIDKTFAAFAIPGLQARQDGTLTVSTFLHRSLPGEIHEGVLVENHRNPRRGLSLALNITLLPLIKCNSGSKCRVFFCMTTGPCEADFAGTHTKAETLFEHQPHLSWSWHSQFHEICFCFSGLLSLFCSCPTSWPDFRGSGAFFVTGSPSSCQALGVTQLVLERREVLSSASARAIQGAFRNPNSQWHP